MVRSWIAEKSQNPSSQDHLYRDYLNVAQRRGDNPLSPATIVTNISLCWDLEELVNIRRQKRRIMRAFQRKFDEPNAKQISHFGLDQETVTKL